MSSSSSTSRRLPLSLPTVLLLALPYMTPSYATSNAPSSLPQIYFSRMGSVGIGGSFSGLDFFSSSSSYSINSTGSSSSTGYSLSADSLVLRSKEGSGTPIGRTNTNGRIQALCWSSNHPFSPSSSSSSTNGTIFIGGNFTTIGGVDALNVAGYDMGSGTFHALGGGTGGGVDGPVEAVYCDDTNSRVWIGGDFDGPSAGIAGYGGNLVLFSEKSGSIGFSPVPFGGLNGKVDTIVPSSSGASVYFGGSFTTTFSSNSTNSTSSNKTSTVPALGAAPNGTVTTGYSGYLTPVALSPSSINLTAIPATTQSAYSKPNILLCPAAGEVFLGRDNSVVNIFVETYKQVEASGIRIGNGLVNGDGTTMFQVVAIPDDSVQTLTYTDPTTGVNQTCSTSCPLSTNSSIVAQDFLFPTSLSITGFQVVLQSWQGSAAGLSRLQLLSTGSAASSVASDNAAVCAADSSTVTTNITTSGKWATCSSSTEIAGTTREVLYVDVPVGSTNKPSVLYSPYVAASGFYDISISIPGCTAMGDCDLRTSVDMLVMPYPGSSGVTKTISQQVTSDTYTSLYQGYVEAQEEGFQPTIKLSLSATPQTPINSNEYEIVAGTVVMTFSSVGVQSSNGTYVQGSIGGNSNINSTSANSTNKGSFGVFEWVLTNSNTSALVPMSNTTSTKLDNIGFSLVSASSASLSSLAVTAMEWQVSSFATLNNVFYVAGNFSQSGNFSDILSVTSSGVVTPLASQGLNGPVNSILTVGSDLYVGGAFTSTALSGQSSLLRLAQYDPSNSGSWSSLAGGVDGVVSELTLGSDGSSLIVTGNFSNTMDSNGNSIPSGGYAIYDTKNKAWATSSSGFTIGNVTQSLVTGKAGGEVTYVAGRIAGISANSAEGIAMLSGSGSDAEIQSLNIALTGSASSSSSSAATKRGYVEGGHRHRISPSSVSSSRTRSWMNIINNVIGKRAPANSTPALPSINATSPAIFAGAFWKNSSASGSPTITIFGGNFTKSSPAIHGVGFFNPSSGSLMGTQGSQLSGVVRALDVDDNSLYVGGDFILGSSNGFGVYDLAKSAWQTGIPALSGTSVNVSCISVRSGTNTVIVAGHFEGAGSLTCAAICSWDTAATRWSTLGSGLQQGEVRSIAFAGTNDNTLVAAGSFLLSDDTLAYVATYSFENSTWNALGSTGPGSGQLPGPVTAMTVDNGNVSSIFASGLSTADETPFLMWWNGAAWSSQNSTMESGSLVQQLVMVPLAEDHATTSSIETNRMLMVSGSLILNSIGDVSTALFDGQYWYPYLTSLTSTGSAGFASALFYSQSSFSFSSHHYLAVGLVVLIAIAISTGLIFLLVLIGLLLTVCRRPSNRNKVVPAAREKDVTSETSSDHARRLGTIQQAVFGGAGGAALGTSLAHKKERTSPESSPRSSFGDAYESPVEEDAEGAGAGGGGGAAAAAAMSGDTHDSSAFHSDAPSELGRPTRMKFDFAGEDSAELTVGIGEEIHVLEEEENSDGRGWILVRTADGRQGVVPASYVW